MEEIIPKKSKLYWGPLLWQIFHLLAEISDKADVLPIWRSWFDQTANIMPCEKCRVHLRHYLRTNPFILLFPPSKNKILIKNHVQQEIMNLHNHVNASTGKPIFTMEQYNEKYGVKKKNDILLEVKDAMNRLEDSWQNIDYITMRKHEYNLWKRSLMLLQSMVV